MKRYKKRIQNLEEEDEKEELLQIAERNPKWQNLPTDFKQACLHFKVRSKEGNVPLKLFPFQEAINHLIDTKQNIYIIKSRQTTCSTLALAKVLHQAVIRDGLNNAFFGVDLPSASQLSDRTKFQILSAGDDIIKLSNPKDNISKSKINFPNNSQINFRGGYSKDNARGLEALSYVVLDEMQSHKFLEPLITAVSPAQTVMGELAKTIGIATPKSPSGFYYDLMDEIAGGQLQENCHAIASGELYSKDFGIPGFYYQEDKNDPNTVLIYVHFYASPFCNHVSRDEYLQSRRQKDRISDSKVQQEYNLSFEDEDETFIASDLIHKAMSGQREVEHDPNCRHYCGIDSSGVTDELRPDGAKNDSDYTSACVIKVDNGKIIVKDWIYTRHSSFEKRISNISALIQKHKCRKIGVEGNHSGSTYGSALKTIFSNENYYCDTEIINNTEKRRPQLVEVVAIALESEQLIFPPNCPLADELFNLVRVGGGSKIQAASGHHDDFFFSLAMAIVVSKSEQENSLQKKLEEGNLSEEEIKKELLKTFS